METLQDIVNVVNTNKGDTALYRVIFNVLTDNNVLKTYTNNSNGIFFNLSSFDKEKINILLYNVNSYIENKKEITELENNRETIIKELSKTIDNSYKTELKDILDSNKKNKNALSTHIDIEISNNNEVKIQGEKALKKKNNQRMKKSIENYQKPIIYKGSYERIKKVLNQSKSTRTSKNNSIEETDRLYESECETDSVLEESVGKGSVYNSDSEAEVCNEDIEEDSYNESDLEAETEDTAFVTKESKNSKKDTPDDIKDLFGSDSE